MGPDPAHFLDSFGNVRRGIRQVVAVPAPAAGAAMSVAVPGGECWRIRCGVSSVATSAAVGNRQINYGILSEGQLVYQTITAASWGPGLNVQLRLLATNQVQQSVTTGATQGLMLPDLVLIPGDQLQTVISAFDAADQVGATTLLVDRYYMTALALSEAAEDHDRERAEVMAILGETGPQIALPPMPA